MVGFPAETGETTTGPNESSIVQLMRQARNPIGFLEDCRKRFGDVYTTRLPGLPPSVTFALSEAAREIFANPGDTMWAGEANEPIEFLVGRTRWSGSTGRSTNVSGS